MPHRNEEDAGIFSKAMREREEEVITKLESVDKGGGTLVFSADEVRVLRKVAKAVRGVEALGWLGGVIKNALVLLGGLLLAWSQLGDWFYTHIIGKGP